MRQTGVLLHISSLPTDYGIGDFGPSAWAFAKYLKSKGHKIWQILPINHCGYGNSPYNPISAFAFNPYLISPELLYQQGLINQSTQKEAMLPTGDTVYYELVYKTKDILLQQASANWLIQNDIHSYIEQHAYQLKPYLAFMALYKVYGDSAWFHWQPEHRLYSEELYNALEKQFESYMHHQAACQAIAAQQLHLFKNHMQELELTLVGDMPLYLSYESAEVWAHPELFDLDNNGNRLHLAGVPPDAFASGGQLWGNPIYNWPAMQTDDFQLFVQRIGQALEYLDILRLDHFIGYVNYWQVDSDFATDGTPILPKSAINGKWVDALPTEFFSKLCSRFGKERFLAEDLGILNDKVCHIRDSFGFPGMIILQFCFEESVPEVQSYPHDRWLYTGTHDNSTLKGWFSDLAPDSASLRHLQAYCHHHRLRDCHRLPGVEKIHLIMQNIAMDSGCEKVIIPFQDIRGLDVSARMNIPGTALGNWQWRIAGDRADFSLTKESN